MTPRHGHAPIPMRQVPGEDDLTVCGDFALGDDHIWIMVPSDEGPTVPIPIRLRLVQPSRAGTPRFPRWDLSGSPSAPTLKPSINTRGHWHGWVRDGRLVEA